MTAKQLYEKAEWYIGREGIPDEARDLIRLLLEYWHSDRQQKSSQQQNVDMMRKSLSYYQLWHRSEEVPGRNTDLMVKRKIGNKGRGVMEYKLARYEKGQFLVEGKETDIVSWTYAPTGNKK